MASLPGGHRAHRGGKGVGTRTIRLFVAVFDDHSDGSVIGLLSLGEIDVEKAIVVLRFHVRTINGFWNDQAALEITVIDFHLPKRAAMMPARIWPDASHDQNTTIESDFDVVFSDPSQLHLDHQMFFRLENIRVGCPRTLRGHGGDAGAMKAFLDEVG